jgi:predicted ATPase
LDRGADQDTSVTEGSPDGTPIRTPDHRVRVFVSSTLGELGSERRAVARAVSALRLTPVMFEAGARPYPPRDLYRAYLAQSDVFVGVYWQRYGWVGPGMEISGLEEELELARGLPRLLYVKAPAPNREPRLAELLARVRAEAAVSYRAFGTPAELGRLVRDDLATILSERFTAGPATAAPTRTPRGRRPLPVVTTSLAGRERAIDDVAEVSRRPEARLVTLTGPGGIGKTRLALAVGERLQDEFGARTAFVPLAAVTRPEQVLAGIAREVGADLAGTRAPLEVLVEELGEDRWLLILDALEQVVEAAADIGALLARCRGVTILATTRTVLGLSAEREYPVPPLRLPAEPDVPVEQLAKVPAVALFVDRARAVRYDFAFNAGNAAAVVGICRRLEGLPLAIELAAARTRLLDPDTLLRRLATSLDALGIGTMDRPERQRTLRATVDWSVGLLDDTERSLLEAVAVFVDGWTVDAAAQVAGLDEDRALELSEALARHSLIYLDMADHGPRSRMLETVRAFVAERLAARSDVADVKRRHSDYYRVLAEQADPPLRAGYQSEWLDRLQTEAGNLATAVEWCLAHDPAPLPHLFRVLWLFWEQREHQADARAWIEQLLPTTESLDLQAQAELLWTAAVTANEVGDDTAALSAREGLASLLERIEDRFLQAVAHLAMAWISPIVGDLDDALQHVSMCVEQLRGQDVPYWTAVALLTTGLVETAMGRHDDARGHLTEVSNLAGRFDNPWLAAVSRIQLSTLAVVQGRLEEARDLIDEALDWSLAARSTRSVSMCLAAFAQLALAHGDAERAALAAGAAEGLRRRVGLHTWPMQRPGWTELVAQIRQALGPDRSDQMYAAGSQLNQRDAVATLRNERGRATAASPSP